MFPPRPNLLTSFKKPARLLKSVAVFGPPPGPAPAIGSNPGGSGTYGPTAGQIGYGCLPYGDGATGPNNGVNGEDPRLVGYVIRLSEFNFIAQRTCTWGGTTMVGASFDGARKFIEAACGQLLRQESDSMATGQQLVKFWNPAYEAAVAAHPVSGFGD